MKIDPTVFSSQGFIFTNRYQGCGLDLTGPSDESFLTKSEAGGLHVAEPKLDGNWAAFFILPGSNMFITRNTNHKECGLDSYRPSCLRAGTLIIGEMGYGTEWAKKRRLAFGHDFMDVFDLLAVDYEDFSYLGDDDRRRKLEEWYASLDAPTQARFRMVPRYTTDFVKEFYAQHEGLVLKVKGAQQYKGGGRKVPHWIKCKKCDEADMVIMDMKLSDAMTKTAEPMVESIGCGQFVGGQLKLLVRVGSMTQFWQKEFAQKFNEYKGRVIRINHYGQFNSGALRHPYLPQTDVVRDDKNATECVFK